MKKKETTKNIKTGSFELRTSERKELNRRLSSK